MLREEVPLSPRASQAAHRTPCNHPRACLHAHPSYRGHVCAGSALGTGCTKSDPGASAHKHTHTPEGGGRRLLALAPRGNDDGAAGLEHADLQADRVWQVGRRRAPPATSPAAMPRVHCALAHAGPTGSAGCCLTPVKGARFGARPVLVNPPPLLPTRPSCRAWHVRSQRHSLSTDGCGNPVPTNAGSWAHHFVNVGLLVGHVLPALAGPHQVEGVVGEVHLQGVHHLQGGEEARKGMLQRLNGLAPAPSRPRPPQPASPAAARSALSVAAASPTGKGRGRGLPVMTKCNDKGATQNTRLFSLALKLTLLSPRSAASSVPRLTWLGDSVMPAVGGEGSIALGT